MTATGYHSTRFTGGYSDLQLAPDVFRVAFRGNGYTSEDHVRDFLLLCAAQLTIAQGAQTFVVLDQRSGAKQVFVGGGQTYGTATPNFAGGFSYSEYTTPPTVITRHRAELVIRLVPVDAAPSDVAYSAPLIRDQLRHKYGLKE